MTILYPITTPPVKLTSSTLTRMVWVTFQREGIHCYPAAATTPALVDVSYLANDHRHMFKFKVSISVQHNDRDIEFIQFKRWLENLYDTSLMLSHKSCEMIAEDLIKTIDEKYPCRTVSVDVSEDGENGCCLTNTITERTL